jgi:uncharacterized protein YbbK (DUF523 family)
MGHQKPEKSVDFLGFFLYNNVKAGVKAMRILVSACLLGVYCRYDGGMRTNEEVLKLAKRHELVPFCPEIYGGLPTPREPAEIRDGRVVTRSGKDVTAEYERGAQEAARLARTLGCEVAILQDRSPSCGVGMVHNGLFDGGLVEGDGVAARLLSEAGVRVIRASDVGTLSE